MRKSNRWWMVGAWALCAWAVAALAAAVELWAGMAWGAVGVTNVTVQQRYPWNGLVDIECTVEGIGGEAEAEGLKFAVSAVEESGKVHCAKHVRVVREGVESEELAPQGNGAYRLVWDARADLGPVRMDNVTIRVAFEAHTGVQLWEGGPLWAETNVGAEEPEEYGLYFWWGDTVGYRREGSAWVASDGSSENFQFDNDPISQQTYGKSISTLQSEGWIVSQDGTYVLAPEHDAAQVQWGGGWRMPTYQELYDLCWNQCDWTWTTQNGVKGYVVRGRGDFAEASIFLPAAGYGLGSSLYDAGSGGYYWSSVPDESHSGYAGDLYFYSGYRGMNGSSRRGSGQSVRPVQGVAQ